MGTTNLAAHAFIEPGEILHVAGAAVWLESMDAPLLQDLEVELCAYIDAVEAAGTLVPNRTNFAEGLGNAWAGFMFAGQEDPRFERIRDHVTAAAERIFCAKMKAAAPSLLTRLQDPDEDGSILFESEVGRDDYGGVAILHHLDVKAFADLLLKDGQLNRSFMGALLRRYQYWGTVCELLDERPWLEALKIELDARATALGPPFEKALQLNFAKSFGEFFGLLDGLKARCATTTPPAAPGP